MMMAKLQILPKDCCYYLCGSTHDRIIHPHHLSIEFQKHNLDHTIFESSHIAYNYLCKESNQNDLILITGSTFIVSDILKYLDKV